MCGEALLIPDAHPGRGIDLAQQAQVHLDVAGHGEGLVHIAAGQHRGGQVLDGEHAGVLGHIAGHGAVVGYIADGQAGQVAGDAHLGHLLDGQGQGVGAVGLAGEGSLPAGVDAGIGHGLLVGAGFPELDAHPELGGSPGAQRQSAQQQHREQDRTGTLERSCHKISAFPAAGSGNDRIT